MGRLLEGHGRSVLQNLGSMIRRPAELILDGEIVPASGDAPRGVSTLGGCGGAMVFPLAQGAICRSERMGRRCV